MSIPFKEEGLTGIFLGYPKSGSPRWSWLGNILKRGEKTHSEQSWDGYYVKKTFILETQHTFTLDREGTYNRPKYRLQDSEPMGFTGVLKDHYITKAHPRRGESPQSQEP